MTQPNQESTDADESSAIDRRKVLKMVGGSAAGIAVMTGTASAWRSQFYGCSQVCTDSTGGAAVVEIDGDYECRILENYNSDRQNQEWGDDPSACYEVSGDESIVGVVHGSECELCINPNNCASNYYDDPTDILAAVNDGRCGCYDGPITLNTDCDVSGTGGGNGRGNGSDRSNGNGRGNDNGNGRGNDNGRGRGNDNGRGNGGGNNGNNGRGKGR